MFHRLDDMHEKKTLRAFNISKYRVLSKGNLFDKVGTPFTACIHSTHCI